MVIQKGTCRAKSCEPSSVPVFEERTDPAGLVLGPTGLGLASNDTLYVADTLLNRIAAIPNAVFRLTSAGAGHTISMDGVKGVKGVYEVRGVRGWSEYGPRRLEGKCQFVDTN
jgi:hypothetical protein